MPFIAGADLCRAPVVTDQHFAVGLRFDRGGERGGIDQIAREHRQQPVLRGVTDDASVAQGVFGGFRPIHQLHPHGRDQPVAVAVMSPDQTLIAVAKRIAQTRDRLGQGRVGNNPPGPGRSHQNILGHHLAGALEQADQRLERLGFDGDRSARNRKYEAALVEFRLAY